MPFIQITIAEGREPEKKEQLIYEVTETVSAVIGCSKRNYSRINYGSSNYALGNCWSIHFKKKRGICMTSVEVKVKRVLHFINGKYENSSDEQTFEVKNPATQEVIAVVSEATEEDVKKVSEAARNAFDHGPWRTMSLADRCDKIRRMAEIILERREEIARLGSARCWKTI